MIQDYNPYEMIRRAEEMTAQSEELKKLIGQMEEAVAEVGRVYQSPTQEAFANKFAEIKPELTTFCTNINSFADGAINHAKKVIDIMIAGGPV